MTTRRLDARAGFGLLAVALIWMAAWFAVVHGGGRSTIAIAAAFDVTASAGLALYVIAGRHGRLPRWVPGATIAIGLVFAKLVLATTPATSAVMALGIAFEGGVLIWLIIRGRRARRAWRIARAGGAPVVEALTAAFVAARLPARLADVLASELALVSMVVAGWRSPARSAAIFTVHRNAGWSLYAGVLMFLTLVETAAVHVVLVTYASTTVAWVVTALSVYTVLWILGDVLALRHGGAIVGADLELRIGARWRGRVSWADIVSITPAGLEHGAVDLSILGANVILTLREPCRLVGLFGRRREALAIALSIDDRDGFIAAVQRRTT